MVTISSEIVNPWAALPAAEDAVGRSAPRPGPGHVAVAFLFLLFSLAGLFFTPPASADDAVVRSDDGSEMGELLGNTLNPVPGSIGDPRSPEFLDFARMQRDRLSGVLRGLGYYAAHVDILIDDTVLALGDDAVAAPATGRGADMTFAAVPGPLYRVRSFEIGPANPQGNDTAAVSVDDTVGLAATAENLATIEADWRSAMQAAGFALATGVERTVIQDDDARLVDVRLRVDVGPVVRLGQVRFQGIRYLDISELQGFVGFAPGERYQPAQIEALRVALLRHPDIESVDVHVSSAPDGSGLHPVVVRLAESPQAVRETSTNEVIGMGALAAAILLLGGIEISRARRGDERPLRSRWSFHVFVALLSVGAVFALLRILTFLGLDFPTA